MQGKRIFVSGGAGVIGLEMVPKLVALGAEVMVGDLKCRPIGYPPEVRYRQGDLNAMTKGEFIAFGPEIFIHLAATFERTTESEGFWDENFHHNVLLSHHLMTLAHNCESLRRVVFASSYLIYDPAFYQFASQQDAPVSLHESDPINPRNLTGMAKFLHEMELRFLSDFESCHFSTLSTRIYRGYGRNSRCVISRWVRALLAGETINVFRLEGLFDFIYAKDTAEGLIRLAASNEVTGIINLGTGQSRKVGDVVNVLRQHFPYMRMQELESNIPFEASQANITQLKSVLGWSPAYDLETAIPEMIAYERAAALAAAAAIPMLSNVLVTSASCKVPLVRAMQKAGRKLDPKIGVIAGDLDASALTGHVADAFWAMPHTVDAELPNLLKGCQERGIGTIFPTRDGELAFWSQARSAFAREGIEIIISDLDAINRCLDKLAFAKFGQVAGLPMIVAATDAKAVGSGPYVVKERFGAGSRGIGLNLDLSMALSHAKGLEEPIFQPFVTGPEISIDGWISAKGVVTGVVLRRRDVVVLGESQVTTTFRDLELEAQAVRALGELGLRGPVVMQAILSPDFGLRIIECNARFGGASTAAIAAGLDMFYWSLAERYKPNFVPHLDRSRCEVCQVRVPSDIVIYDPNL